MTACDCCAAERKLAEIRQWAEDNLETRGAYYSACRAVLRILEDRDDD